MVQKKRGMHSIRILEYVCSTRPSLATSRFLFKVIIGPLEELIQLSSWEEKSQGFGCYHALVFDTDNGI